MILDGGAVNVLKHSRRSLLRIGVKSVAGYFTRGEAVACVSEAGLESARGLCDYNAEDTRSIIGHPSDTIESLLGCRGDEALGQRDNLVLL